MGCRCTWEFKYVSIILNHICVFSAHSCLKHQIFKFIQGVEEEGGGGGCGDP